MRVADKEKGNLISLCTQETFVTFEGQLQRQPQVKTFLNIYHFSRFWKLLNSFTSTYQNTVYFYLNIMTGKCYEGSIKEWSKVVEISQV